MAINQNGLIEADNGRFHYHDADIQKKIRILQGRPEAGPLT